MIANRKSLVADQSVSVPMTLSDLERRNAKDHIFAADPRNYAHTVWPRTTTFGEVTRGEDPISRGQPRSPSKGAGPSAPIFVTDADAQRVRGN